MTGSRHPLRQDLAPGHWPLRSTLLILTLASGARASETEPSAPGRVQAALLYTAPEQCPSSSTFWQGVTSRSRRIEQIAPDHAELIVRVTVRPTATGFRGELQIIRSGTATDARQVNGIACQDVVDALALTTALGLDPDATVGSDTPSDWDGSQSTQRTETEFSPSPAPSSTAPAKNGEVNDDGADSENAEEGAADGDVADDDAVSTEPSGPDEGPGQISLAVGGGWVLAEPVNVGPSVGGAGFVAVIPEHVRFSSPRVDLGFYAIYSDPLAPTANARFSLVTGELRVCPVEAVPNDWLHLTPCVAVQAGRLEGSGQRLTDALTVQSVWFSLGMAARLSIYLTQALHLELSGAAQFPMVPQRYNIGMPPTRVAETVAVSAWLTLGIGYVFDL